MGSSWVAGLLVIWALAVAYYDVRQRRVPNALLILLGVPALLTVAFNRQGLLGAGTWGSLAGLLLGVAPLLAGYVIRQVGAGDVKLSALQGFVLGWAGTGEFLLISGVVLGLMSAFAVLRRRFGGDIPQKRLPAALALVVGFIVVLLVDH